MTTSLDDDQGFIPATNNNRLRRFMMIAIIVVVVVLIAMAAVTAGRTALASRNDLPDNELALLDTDEPELVVEVIPDTPTAVPPTIIPLATATPLPSPTALPTPSPTAAPVMVELTGPEYVPVGLPSPVSWTIRLISGPIISVRLDDLGGAMVVTDNQRQAIIQHHLAVDSNGAGLLESSWTITGVIDPNVAEGTFGLLVETSDFAERLTLRWSAADIAAPQIKTITVSLNGQSSSNNMPGSDSSPIATGGYITYESDEGFNFEYPGRWYVIEEPGAIVVVPEAGDLRQPEGNSLLITTEPIGHEDTADTLLDHLLSNSTMTANGETLVIGERSTTIINGLPATSVSIEVVRPGTDPIKGIVIVVGVFSHDLAIIGFALSSEPDNLVEFSRLLNSIKFAGS